MGLNYTPLSIRWPNGAFSQAQAASYIAGIMLFGFPNNPAGNTVLADDVVKNSTFNGNTNFQGGTANGVVPAHLVKAGNAIVGQTNPNALF